MAKKASVSEAMAVGQAMAEATLKRREQAHRKRERALRAAKIAPPPPPLPSKMLAKAPLTHASAGVIIAEGDSWFDYPLHDVLSDLEDSYGFDVESVSHRGDTVEDMAYSDGQLDDFSRRLEKVLKTNVEPRAILLSGGGNDVAGDEFAILLNHAASSIAGFNESIVAGVVDQRARNAYVTILKAITEICKAYLGHPVRIVVHGYAYPVPDGRGFLGGWPFPGPWLEPGFRRKGYEEKELRKQMCAALIDRFNKMLANVAKESGFEHVKYLNLRKVLSNGADYKTWWANELHPTPKGFKAVTAEFAAAI